MDNIMLVFKTVLRFANTQLNFPPFSFTILQASICFSIAAIIVNFIKSIFE